MSGLSAVFNRAQVEFEVNDNEQIMRCWIEGEEMPDEALPILINAFDKKKILELAKEHLERIKKHYRVKDREDEGEL